MMLYIGNPQGTKNAHAREGHNIIIIHLPLGISTTFSTRRGENVFR